jgi:tetratricopeptide (TPR) repeat protein
MTDPASKLFGRAMKAIQREELAEAERVARELHSLRYSGAFEIDALVALARDDLPAAERHLEKGLEVAPGVWGLWQLLGNVRSDLGRFDDAADAYREALTCEGASAESIRLNCAILDMRRGRIEVARDTLAALLDEVDAGDMRNSIETSWFHCLRIIRNEGVSDRGKLFEVLLDAPLAADPLPEDLDPARRYGFFVKAHVAAGDAADIARIVAEDLADLVPGVRVCELEEKQDAAGLLVGVYWLSSQRFVYPIDDDG